MVSTVRRRSMIHLGCILVALLVLGQLPAGGLAAPLNQNDTSVGAPEQGQVAALQVQGPAIGEATVAVDCDDTDCPDGPDSLPKCVERTKFCVYYTTSSISETEAEWAADVVQDYWDRFVALGFNEPKYSTKLRVELTNITGDCNGGTDWSANDITTYAGCFDSDLMAQATLGHELTHRVQYAHDSGSGAPIQTKFLKEGTARATEDNWFTEIDHRTDALTADFSFNKELNSYLSSTNNDLTSYDMRYKSCLWWKYAMEQYGTTFTEPQRGIDFVRQVYGQNTAGYSGISAVNRALSTMGTGTSFNESFKQFAVANWTKDLTGVPNGSYNYIDEDEAGNPAAYGPLVPASGGTIQVGSSAVWSNQAVARYGLRYYTADVGTNCPVVSATFHRDGDGPAFYHVITQNGSAFKTHVRGSGVDWTQAFLDDGIGKVVAIVGSLDNSSQVDVTLGCADPVLDIKLPNNAAVARVQPSTKFLAQVLVTNGSPNGPVVAGLTNSDFVARVGGIGALVTGGGFIQEQYWLVIEAPDSLSDGTYDLEVILEEPGTSTPLASDTNADSVVYTADLIDQVLVIDRSGSMGYGAEPRLPAAQDAASFYVDVTRYGDGLAVVPYNHDVNPSPFNMQVVDAGVRSDAKTYINDDLSASGLTSIGDGLAEAVKQRLESPTENPLCSFVLLSDGMENTALFWADVQAEVIDSGCPVTAIAFGPESDETLMQEIATATGGLYFYNDVYVSTPRADAGAAAITPEDVALELGSTYEYAEGQAEGRQRLLLEKGQLSQEASQAKHEVFVDETVYEAVFALDWYQLSWAELELQLTDPDGKVYDRKNPGYTFEDYENGHVGWRIRDPKPGLWQLLVKWVGSEKKVVPYQVLVSGRTNLTLELLLPDRLGTRFFTGNRVPIYAFLSFRKPIPEARVEAFVTAPDGTETRVVLSDDGEHDDGMAGDGFYAGVYTRVNQAEPVLPHEDAQADPNDEGAYRVLARATHEKFQREAIGAFSVLEGPDLDKDRLPDPFEQEYGVTDPAGDPDLDGLSNYGEYEAGTNPRDPDTDDGGEKDGSEVRHGREPLDPRDDAIVRPGFFEVRPLNKGVLLRFDVMPAYSFLRLYRAEKAGGPWESFVLKPSISHTGIYSDTNVENGRTYFYKLEAAIVPGLTAGEQVPSTPAAEEINSALLSSEPVTPREDPLLPEALVIINDGAPSTRHLDVTLSFAPYESEGTDGTESFKDIAWMLLSNDPSFGKEKWQPFDQKVPWTLDAQPGEVARVYVRFRDEAGNESVGTEVGMILYAHSFYLPLVTRGSE